MGVLTPAIKSGIKVKLSAGWCENGSSEPIKYSALLGVVGTLHRNVALGLWTVQWPSSAVNAAQFCDPFPVVGAPGQGLAVRIALALRDRIDAVCGTSEMKERFVNRTINRLCGYVNLQPSRVSSIEVKIQTIVICVHRSVTSDSRAPMVLAQELVKLINNGETQQRVPEVLRANVVVDSRPHKILADSARASEQLGNTIMFNFSILKETLSRAGQVGCRFQMGCCCGLRKCVCQPHWMLVYTQMYSQCFCLPLKTLRERRAFDECV